MFGVGEPGGFAPAAPTRPVLFLGLRPQTPVGPEGASSSNAGRAGWCRPALQESQVVVGKRRGRVTSPRG